MKKSLLALFAVLLLCSCGGNRAARKVSGFFEDATERVEEATSLNEIKDINELLAKNIAIYSLSLSEEEYQEWVNDPEANRTVQEAEYEYKKAKQERERLLKGE